MLFSKIKQLLLALVVVSSASCQQKGATAPEPKPIQDIFVGHSNAQIAYSGRVDSSKGNATALYWSGTAIRFNFEGESIAAILQDQTGYNYYNVRIDKDSFFILRPDTTKREYVLAKGLSKGPHHIEIFRRTEAAHGKTSFYGFQLKGNPKVLDRPAEKQRKIEFYGNSITAGYGVEDFSGRDSPDSVYTNNERTYAAITARHFDAEYRAICWSGIGIMVSWFPIIMPELYNRLDPLDSNSRWDFTQYQPDLVVINLFQNDSWIVNMPKYAEFKTRFGDKAPTADFIIDAYADFLKKLRTAYPNAHIIAALGNMDVTKTGSKWPGYIESALKKLGDAKMYSHFVPYKNSKGHPNIKEHEAMAKSLIEFIENQIKW